MPWFLKKEDGAVFGPVSENELLGWAQNGRIAPEDMISTDKHSWQSAPDAEFLEMDWFIEEEDEENYGPLHLLALREPLQDGMLLAQTIIRHKSSGEQKRLGQTLIERLDSDNARLERDLQKLREPPSTDRRTGSRRPEPQTADNRERTEVRRVELPDTWTETARSRDFYVKESARWEKLYIEGQQQLQKREAELQQRIDDLLESEKAARTRLNQVEIKLKQSEEERKRLECRIDDTRTDGDGGQLIDELSEAKTAYEALSGNYESLLRQLTEKNEQLREREAALAETERSFEIRLEQAEKQRKAAQADAAETLKKLEVMERDYLELLHSFRQINDRFVRMRQNLAATDSPGPADAAGRDTR